MSDFFFRAQAVEEALRKDRDCPVEKETPKKEKGGGQAVERKRSPLHLVWKRGRARSAKVHACGAEIKQEFQEISERTRHASRGPRGSFRNLVDSGRRTKKRLIGKAATSVPDGRKKRNENHERKWNGGKVISASVSKSKRM